MTQFVFDAEAAARVESLYRIRDAARRRGIVRQALGARRGEHVVDVGCGPGFYCAEIAEDVGPTGSVVGVDSSDAMLELATRRCSEHRNVQLRKGDALAIPADDGRGDAAICVQVLEYVAQPTAALHEMRRVLRSGGRIVIWDVDWTTLSMRSEDAARMQRVLVAWDEHLTHPSLPRELGARLREAGFADIRMDAHVFATARFDPETYGAALTPFIGSFVADRNGIAVEEAQAWLDEQRQLGERGDFYFTCTQMCFTATKPS